LSVVQLGTAGAKHNWLAAAQSQAGHALFITECAKACGWQYTYDVHALCCLWWHISVKRCSKNLMLTSSISVQAFALFNGSAMAVGVALSGA
jgi:hypothetical protein